jgi:hypothetical protein
MECLSLLHFRTPFAWEIEDLRLLVKEEWPGIPFRTQSLKRDYRKLVSSGDGIGFSLADNCYACRSYLLARAARYMERIGADYLVTGEVPGKYGLTMDDFRRMETTAGLEHRVIRPLCIDEKRLTTGDLASWERALDEPPPSGDDGRLERLAVSLGLEPTDPLSCQRRCKLTAPGFGERVVNLFGEDGFTLNALRLLDFELYYKISPDIKVVIARDEQEKRNLQNLLLPQDLRVYPATPHGPMTLVRARWQEKSADLRARVIDLAARITATHTSDDHHIVVPIYYRFENEEETQLVNAIPFSSFAEIASLDRVEVAPRSWDAQRIGSG